MQLTGNANPFLFLRLHQPFVERADLLPVFLDDAQPNAMSAEDQRDQRRDRERHEPGGLVERRRDDEGDGGAGFVPHAAVIGRHHAEAVGARRQIGIEGLAAIARILPVAVVAFEP